MHVVESFPLNKVLLFVLLFEGATVICNEPAIDFRKDIGLKLVKLVLSYQVGRGCEWLRLLLIDSSDQACIGQVILEVGNLVFQCMVLVYQRMILLFETTLTLLKLPNLLVLLIDQLF